VRRPSSLAAHCMASKRSGVVKRVIWLGVGLLVLAFAVEGGEFGTRDLIRNRREIAHLTRATEALKRVVDSLRRYQDSVEHSPAVPEPIAREDFGLRWPQELIYRLTHKK